MTKLTTKSIKAARYDDGDSSAEGWKRGQRRDVRWDDDLSGFGLRIYPSGRKAFIVSYRAEGRKRMMTIGDFGTFTLAQARTRARKHLVSVEDGADPIEQRRKAAQGAGAHEHELAGLSLLQYTFSVEREHGGRCNAAMKAGEHGGCGAAGDQNITRDCEA